MCVCVANHNRPEVYYYGNGPTVRVLLSKQKLPSGGLKPYKPQDKQTQTHTYLITFMGLYTAMVPDYINKTFRRQNSECVTAGPSGPVQPTLSEQESVGTQASSLLQLESASGLGARASD